MGMLTLDRPAPSRSRFHPLTVTAVTPVAADGSAVAVDLAVPGPLRPAFVFSPGQYLTVRHRTDDGTELRRSYSVCSTPGLLAREGTVRIGVRAVTGGAFSTHAVHRLAAGDVLEALPPLGAFTTALDPARRRRYAALVAGSGITPVLSLIAAALATEPHSTFTVLYGNRYARSAMFTEALADLKDRHGHRLQVTHLFSREEQQVGLAAGRITPDRLRALLDGPLAPGRVDEWFLCGPPQMVAGAARTLAGHGVAPGSVRTELFRTGDPAPAPPPAAPPADGTAPELTVSLDGLVSTVRVAPGTTLLDAALAVRPDLPWSCKTGVCATCRARVTSGSATMGRTFTLDADEVAAGYVLTCQAVPAGDHVTLDFDR
jgi:ring-1,2-phenylacetyl-CoA epoxidase subunit PaaE